MNAHDRFESLAGAVMLGEATPHERASFDAHAASCDRCRADVSDGALVTARIALASESERWRPAQPIVERLRSRRSARARVTLGALGWAVALSLVINVAFVSGIGARVGGAFLSVAVPESDVASMPITLESAHRDRVALAVPALNTWRARIARGVRRPHPRRPNVPPIAVRDPRSAPAHEPTLAEIPDLLAGIDLYGDGSTHRALAAAPLPRGSAHDEDRTSLRPCRGADGRLER